jgi:hypothetical protein
MGCEDKDGRGSSKDTSLSSSVNDEGFPIDVIPLIIRKLDSSRTHNIWLSILPAKILL